MVSSFVGGKKKPLKQPKKGSDYVDEVKFVCVLLDNSSWWISLLLNSDTTLAFFRLYELNNYSSVKETIAANTCLRAGKQINACSTCLV